MDFKSFVKNSALGILLKSSETGSTENVANEKEPVGGQESVVSGYSLPQSRHGIGTNIDPNPPSRSQTTSHSQPSSSHGLLASLLSSTPCAPTPSHLEQSALEQISSKSGIRHPHANNPPTQAVLPQARVAPTTPPIVPNAANNPLNSPIIPAGGHPRLEKARFQGLFAVSLSTANLDSISYVAVVMDKGTLLVPSLEAEPLLNGNLELGKRFNLKLLRHDPDRVSFDRVELNLGVKKYCVEKPGSAAKVVNQLNEKPSFYLQATAVVRVDSFLVRERQRRWVIVAKLLSQGFWAGGVQDWRNQSPEVWKEQCELVHHPDLKCFLQRCKKSTAVPPAPGLASSLPSSPSVPSISSISLLTTPTVPDIRYPALSVSQALSCTLCINCKRKFKYAIEFLFHFTFKKTCLRVVLKRRSDKSLFFEKLNQTIQSKVLVPESSLCCLKSVGMGAESRVCGFRSTSVLQYCMHSDKHVPDSGELFACCLCTGLFFTPFSIYRHKCFVRLELDNGKVLRPNQLFSVYAAVSANTLDLLLACPSCGKRYDYVSGLLNHLKKSNSRCLAALSCNYTKFLTQERNLSLSKLFLDKFGLVEVPTQCEVCQEMLISELAYCMHKDHHTVAGDAKFVCKGCQADCTSPCAFYRHTCSSPEVAWCPLCERATAHEKRDLKFEEIVVEDDDEAEAEETASSEALTSEAESAGEEDITFLEVLETQRTSLADDEDEVSIVFEDTSTSQANSPDVKPSTSLKRTYPEQTAGVQKKQRLDIGTENLKTKIVTAKPSNTTATKSIGPELDAELQQAAPPLSSSARSSTAGSEGEWLRDWLGLPNEEKEDKRSPYEEEDKSTDEGTKEPHPVAPDEDEDDGPEMEGSGLTPKQRARAKEKEKRKEFGQSVKPTQATGKVAKGYVLVPEKEAALSQSDSKLTRQCLDQMFDDDDSDTGDDPLKVDVKKEVDAFETHSIGCVQIDQDVLREINTLENLKVEPEQNDDIMSSQPSLPNPTDDSISNKNLNVSSKVNLDNLCILDTRLHISDSDGTEKNCLKPLKIKLRNVTNRKSEDEKNKCVEKAGTSQDHSLARDRSEEEDERGFWAQYYCTTCQWLLGGAEGLLQHNREQRGRHHNVKPLWSFNQQEVRVQDLKKSRKFGVMVRELEIEYQKQVKEEEEGLTEGQREEFKSEVIKNAELQKERLRNDCVRLEGLKQELDKEIFKHEEKDDKIEKEEFEKIGLNKEDKDEEDIKLKISKASNGRFSVIN